MIDPQSKDHLCAHGLDRELVDCKQCEADAARNRPSNQCADLPLRMRSCATKPRYIGETRDLFIEGAKEIERLRAALEEVHVDRNEQLQEKYALIVERDRLRALLRDARGSIRLAADANCVCVDGPQTCKYCLPHRALLECIDAALESSAPATQPTASNDVAELAWRIVNSATATCASANSVLVHRQLIGELREALQQVETEASLERDPLDIFMDMDSAPKDGTRILALVSKRQFYRDTDRPQELIPVVVRWTGDHTGWSMMGIGGLQPALWQAIRLSAEPAGRCRSGLGYQGQFLTETQCTLREGHSGPHQYASDPRSAPETTPHHSPSCPQFGTAVSSIRNACTCGAEKTSESQSGD